MMEFVNGKDDIPYMKWKIKNVWNHQPGNLKKGITNITLIVNVFIIIDWQHGDQIMIIMDTGLLKHFRYDGNMAR